MAYGIKKDDIRQVLREELAKVVAVPGAGERLSPKEVAAQLNCGLRSVYRYLEEGKLEGNQTASGQWRITRSALKKFLGSEPGNPADGQVKQ